MLDLLELAPFYVWRYNRAVEIVNFPYMSVGASGICPHCGDQSYFHPVSQYVDASSSWHKIASAARCQSCKNFVLVIGERIQSMGERGYQLKAVYPLGKPKDHVDTSVIPVKIAGDFSEALRCQWINAYKACVVMCRRAVQASALGLGAPKGKKLDKQIDALFTAGKITEALKDFAHVVRLTGNIGAHPDKNYGAADAADLAANDIPEEDDNLEDVTPKDADDIVEFTREYLHHVYVMPAKLKARKSPPPATTTT